MSSPETNEKQTRVEREIIVLPDTIYEELKAAAAQLEMPLRRYLAETLVNDAAERRLPRFCQGGDVRLPGRVADDDDYPFPSPEQCYRISNR